MVCRDVSLLDLNIFGFNCSCPNNVILHGIHYSKADLSRMTELVLSCLGRLCSEIKQAMKKVQLGLGMGETRTAQNQASIEPIGCML